MQRLPDTSLTSALLNGGRDHFGWGVDRHIQADIFDALNVNTKATGQWQKGKAPKFPAWPRPSSKSKKSAKAGKPDKPVSVADLYTKFGGKPTTR